MIDKFIALDEDGYFLSMGLRVEDTDYGLTLLQNLQKDEKGRYLTIYNDKPIWVETFDEPLVALQVMKDSQGQWTLLFPYGYLANFSLETLSLDEWDRFHGTIENNISFVMSRQAQAEFFRLVDEFDDDSITVAGKTYTIPTWFIDEPQIGDESFWSKKYQENFMPWDLEKPAPALEQSLNQLKIPKQRILVLGCGTGADAAHFAERGHLVTAVDISPEAIRRAKEKYGQIQNLEFLLGDVFKLPASFNKSFDLIFEHTCFCAVSPFRRTELINIWKKLLVEGGHLLGIFFVWDRRSGPPFGGSEWEIRRRLKKDFEFLYWTRWKNSVEGRQGAELVVYARKLNLLK